MLKKNAGPVRVKICGITRLEDALAAVRFGADAIGFVFAGSPRQISVRKAAEISQKLGPFVTRVGVFVNHPAGGVLRILREAGLDVAQLHGDETPQDCKKLSGSRIIKVFRITSGFKPGQTARYAADAFMLETAAPVAGGSGRSWDWSRLAGARFARPVIVTGGLNPSNVQKAIRTLHPYAVDVSSGVEKKPGIKNHDLMEKFIRNAKTA